MANVTVPNVDHIWEQSEDLVVEVVYKNGDNGVPLNDTSHAVRMDIADKSGNVVFSFNSDDLEDSTLDQTGEADNEVTFPQEVTGLIRIKVPRRLTLTGGALPAGNPHKYDLFIRNKEENTQRKLLKGQITINPSVTLWN